ncbi:MAG: sigma-54-dependent Fis family transcriptional regulator [Deltaproteobacteria bacterium]|nr:sigma-54-dependent Fis family transcriptional regulator [Deltaproteobacteria bacterium]
MAPEDAPRGRLLVVDDEAPIRQALSDLFVHAGFEVHAADGPEAALAVVRARPIDLVLLDLRLGAASGLELLPALKAEQPEAAVIVLTALATIETAVEAMRRGADNFLTKPLDPPRLLALVDKGLESHSLRRTSARLGRLAARPAASVSFDSAAMRKAQALADAVAPRATTVLLMGETGSGKGMLASYVHQRSTRAAAPFVELNCAGLSKELTESELFGHERGAFTGATSRKLGLLEAADGGTLFLDEIGEMELPVQAKLLKVLEQGRFRRVGGLAEIAVDVRIIAASHRDLERDAAAGRFRADLYYRLNVFTIRVPPLRERREEVLPLARRFLALERRGHSLSDEAIELLEGYDWPGNVRELKNVIERAAILAPSGAAITAEHLPPLAVVAGPIAASLDAAERSVVEAALRANQGNILATARALGVSRGLLYRKIAKFGLKVE